MLRGFDARSSPALKYRMGNQRDKEPLVCTSCQNSGWVEDLERISDDAGIERCLLVGYVACPKGCRNLPPIEIMMQSALPKHA